MRVDLAEHGHISFVEDDDVLSADMAEMWAVWLEKGCWSECHWPSLKRGLLRLRKIGDAWGERGEKLANDIVALRGRMRKG